MNNHARRFLYVSNGLFIFGASMLIPIYPLFAESIGADVFLVGALVATMLASKMFITIILWFFGDGVAEKEYLLVFSFILRAIGWIGLFAFPTILGLFCVQIILGFGDGIGSPSFRTIFAAHLDSGNEVKSYSEWELTLAIGGSLGALAGGFIVSVFGFNVLFVLMSTLAVIASVMTLLQPRSLL